MYLVKAFVITLVITSVHLATPLYGPVGQVEFSGYTWRTDAYNITTNTKPNQDIPLSPTTYVDQDGHMHLTITYRDGKWWSTEAVNTQSLGYGTYTFYVGSKIDTLDPSAVLALFIWDPVVKQEIDIEFSRWGKAVSNNTTYTVQPGTIAGNTCGFFFSPTSDQSVHTIVWTPTYIYFQSEQIFATTKVIRSWKYTGKSIPPAANEKTTISFWVHPSGQIFNPTDVVIDRFEFRPLQ